MFVDHTKCCSHKGVQQRTRRPTPLTNDPKCNATQNAPLPPIVSETNVTMRILVDGGLVEVYGMDAVALTAIAAPSPNVAPYQRIAQTFVEDANTVPGSICHVEGWKLSL